MQGYDFDKEHLIKELGNTAWFLAEAATALDIYKLSYMETWTKYIKDILMDLIQMLLSTDKRGLILLCRVNPLLFIMSLAVSLPLLFDLPM